MTECNESISGFYAFVKQNLPFFTAPFNFDAYEADWYIHEWD